VAARRDEIPFGLYLLCLLLIYYFYIL